MPWAAGAGGGVYSSLRFSSSFFSHSSLCGWGPLACGDVGGGGQLGG